MLHSDDPFTTIQPEAKAHLAAPVPDVIPPTLAQRLVAAIEREHGPLPPARPLTGADIQRACRFCRGRGCLACDAAKDAEYTRQFPTPPQPLATFALNDPEEMQLARYALGREALEAGEAEVLRRLADATVQQARLQTADREDIP